MFLNPYAFLVALVLTGNFLWDLIVEKIQKKYEGIAKKLKGEHAFSGYVIAHSFRANNNDGKTLISNYIFFADKALENIIFTLSEYEVNEYGETINQIKEKMEESDQWFSDDDDE